MTFWEIIDFNFEPEEQGELARLWKSIEDATIIFNELQEEAPA